jgi:hypothetical protein
VKWYLKEKVKKIIIETSVRLQGKKGINLQGK